MNEFRILGELRDVETIAAGSGVRIRRHLIRVYGRGRWCKLNGTTTIQFADGTVREADLHWFEAHGIGRRNIKIKRILK